MFNHRNVSLGQDVKIGQNVKIGDNTRIYDNVKIGDNTIICNNCSVGEPVNDFYYNDKYVNPPTVIGPNSLIRSHTIIYCDSIFGENFATGHRVTIREKSIFGMHCSVGTLSDIQGYVQFGDYCRLHSNVHIGQKSTIGNFVFIYPYVVFTNDPTPPSNVCIGPTVGNYTQIAVGAILFPGIKVGENCLIGAGAVVTEKVKDYSVVVGNPGKVMCDIKDLDSKEKKGKHYPWMYNFDRGMPWAGIGYDKWMRNKKSD
jgi:acetyltransferase-like isoleucine patch superfamily enzyme